MGELIEMKDKELALNDLAIELYLHCGLCMEELPDGESPRSYSSIELGWTKQGLQVWCKRHDCNMLHVDFKGIQHPADTTRKGDS